MKKGYFGIGIYMPKTETNLGTLWRSAHNFGADFIFTIGDRYREQRSDTTKAPRHIPLFSFTNLEGFKEHLSPESELVFIEQVTGAHCRCMEKDCPNIHYVDCYEHYIHVEYIKPKVVGSIFSKRFMDKLPPFVQEILKIKHRRL